MKTKPTKKPTPKKPLAKAEPIPYKAPASPPPVVFEVPPAFTPEDIAAIGVLVKHHAQDGETLGAAAQRLLKTLDTHVPAWQRLTDWFQGL